MFEKIKTYLKLKEKIYSSIEQEKNGNITIKGCIASNFVDLQVNLIELLYAEQVNVLLKDKELTIVDQKSKITP